MKIKLSGTPWKITGSDNMGRVFLQGKSSCPLSKISTDPTTPWHITPGHSFGPVLSCLASGRCCSCPQGLSVRKTAQTTHIQRVFRLLSCEHWFALIHQHSPNWWIGFCPKQRVSLQMTSLLPQQSAGEEPFLFNHIQQEPPGPNYKPSLLPSFFCSIVYTSFLASTCQKILRILKWGKPTKTRGSFRGRPCIRQVLFLSPTLSTWRVLDNRNSWQFPGNVHNCLGSKTKMSSEWSWFICLSFSFDYRSYTASLSCTEHQIFWPCIYINRSLLHHLWWNNPQHNFQRLSSLIRAAPKNEQIGNESSGANL